MARMNSLFRRKSSFRREAPSFGDLVLENDGHRLCCGGNSCRLSQTEYDLMNLLVLAGGSVTARSVLLHKIWGLDTDVEDGNLDNYIYFLRKRLKKLNSLVSIRNQRGAGYYLSESV